MAAGDFDGDQEGGGLSALYEQGWLRHEIVEFNSNWPGATADAEARGGRQAAITSPAEFDLNEGLLEIRRTLTSVPCYRVEMVEEP